jgi:hypothetical protein
MGHVDLKSMEPYQHHDLTALRKAINQRNQHPTAPVPRFGHVFGHGGQNGSEEASGENYKGKNILGSSKSLDKVKRCSRMGEWRSFLISRSSVNVELSCTPSVPTFAAVSGS